MDDAFQLTQLLFVLDIVLISLPWYDVGGVGCWKHRRVGHCFDKEKPSVNDGGPLAGQFCVG